MSAVYAAIDAAGKGSGRFAVASIEEGRKLAAGWTDGAGCNAILEVRRSSPPSQHLLRQRGTGCRE